MNLTGNIEKDSKYYDAIYSRGYNTGNYLPLYEATIKLIEKHGIPRKILEIGCGVGDLGKMLIERGHTYRGFDFSPSAVECSRKLCPEGNFTVGDAYDPASYLPVNYETVVALEVLGHLDDLRIVSTLPSGVRLIASVPDYNDTAHLRLYKNPNEDIVGRFASLLSVTEILAFSGKDEK